VAVLRLCLMVAIEGYRQSDNRARTELQGRLRDALDGTFKSADIELDRTWRREWGDGQLILLPVGAKAAIVIPPLISELLGHLDRDRNRAPLIPMRLRVSIVPGSVTRTQDGYAGYPVATAERLAESSVVREELTVQPTALFALIVSDDLYRDVFLHGGGERDAGGFRRVAVDLPDQEWHAEAWVRGCGPGSLKSPANRAFDTLRSTIMPVLGALPGSVSGLMDNPVVENEIDGTAHDTGGDSHEELIEVQSATDEHEYLADDNGCIEEFGDRDDYTVADYESFDSPSDSHEDLY
jgi:hypothetical protein